MKKLISSDKHYYSMPVLIPPSKYVKKFKLLSPAYLNSLQKFKITLTYPKTTSVIYFQKSPYIPKCRDLTLFYVGTLFFPHRANA